MLAIKGMKMPYSCITCGLNSYNMCRVTGYNVTYEIARQERRSDCPLIELPDGLYQVQGKKIWKYHGKGEK